ncbi:MAG: DUF6638 family protein [Planktomarina sp.]
MKRLIEKGLMFGNLVSVTSPILIDRYNRALERLTGRTTALLDFHIDISGYSPEVGEELNDPLYLNPRGVNRQFIILSPDQKHAPLLDAQFSFSRDQIRGFIDANEAALFALTARDAVAGELVNSVFDVSSPARLLDIRRIEVEADTTEDILRNAADLTGKIKHFMADDMAWQDDVLIAQMIGLAKTTGDVTRNPVTLTLPDTSISHFWTAHYDGAFVFRFGDATTIIATEPAYFEALLDVTILGLDDSHEIANFLFAHSLVEPILDARGVKGAAIVQRKMDMMVAHAAAEGKTAEIPFGTSGLRRLARRMVDDLPSAYFDLAALHRWATADGAWPRITAEDPAYFYSLRATAGPERDLVNRLLAALTPLDLRQMFICHKEAFYGQYAKMPEAMKQFTANFLEQEYQGNKAATRDALFGQSARVASVDHRIAAVGPWGAVRR